MQLCGFNVGLDQRCALEMAGRHLDHAARIGKLAEAFEAVVPPHAAVTDAAEAEIEAARPFPLYHR